GLKFLRDMFVSEALNVHRAVKVVARVNVPPRVLARHHDEKLAFLGTLDPQGQPEIRPISNRHRVTILAWNTRELHRSDLWDGRTVLPRLVEDVAPMDQLVRRQRHRVKALITEPSFKGRQIVLADSPSGFLVFLFHEPIPTQYLPRRRLRNTTHRAEDRVNPLLPDRMALLVGAHLTARRPGRRASGDWE